MVDLFDRANTAGKLAESYPTRNRWWGANPDIRRAEKIDLVAGSKTTILFVEIRWVNRPIGLDVLEALGCCSILVPVPRKYQKHYTIYAEQGFTSELAAPAERRPDLVFYSSL